MPAEPDEVTKPEADTPATEPETPPAPKKRAARSRSKATTKEDVPPAPAEKEASTPAPEEPEERAEEEVRAPKRATIDSSTRDLLALRRALADRRPIFGRQAANRYFRIGRDGTWRRPRGLQSKQRRHYGYRPKIVRIGYRSPARVRGLVPSGFKPVLVRTSEELAVLDAHTEAAVIARTVGTRRRLVLEEEAQKLGIRVLNPIVHGESEA